MKETSVFINIQKLYAKIMRMDFVLKERNVRICINKVFLVETICLDFALKALIAYLHSNIISPKMLF